MGILGQGYGVETEIVMPLVTVSSTGGPHDDEAYAAGWECGKIDAHLEVLAGCYPLSATVLIDNLAQLVLIAMRYEYELTYAAARNEAGEVRPGYAFVSFTPAGGIE